LKTIYVEGGPEAFEDLHDKEWIESVISIIDGTNIEKVTDEFLAHWWGTSRAFLLPALLVDGVYSAASQGNPEFPISKDSLWEQYLNINAFKGALWKSSESSYCSIYYAYENLILGVVTEITGRSLRITDKTFNSEFIGVFGESLMGRVWTSPALTTAKEIRHAIVHNGGKVTGRLDKMQKKPLIENGDVLISASDMRSLFKYLKPLVVELLTEAVKKCS